MMKIDLLAYKLDVAEFARKGGELFGELCLQDMPRLAELCTFPLPSTLTLQTPLVYWSVQGELEPQSEGEPQVWMYLQLEAYVPLRCERCLKGVIETLHLEQSYRFVATEEQAVLEDEECEEDVLVLTRALDIITLCEDELILALPYMPLHEVCPDPLVQGLDQAGLALEIDDEDFDLENEKANPFAVLEALRKKLH